MEKKVIVVKQFRDLKHGNIKRKVGSVLIVDEERAKVLIERKFAKPVIEIKPKVEKKVQEIETAVKEEKKEKAVKEKAVKTLTKKATKKNAKK